jgi:hypothetical protein
MDADARKAFNATLNRLRNIAKDAARRYKDAEMNTAKFALKYGGQDAQSLARAPLERLSKMRRPTPEALRLLAWISNTQKEKLNWINRYVSGSDFFSPAEEEIPTVMMTADVSARRTGDIVPLVRRAFCIDLIRDYDYAKWTVWLVLAIDLLESGITGPFELEVDRQVPVDSTDDTKGWRYLRVKTPYTPLEMITKHIHPSDSPVNPAVVEPQATHMETLNWALARGISQDNIVNYFVKTLFPPSSSS